MHMSNACARNERASAARAAAVGAAAGLASPPAAAGLVCGRRAAGGGRHLKRLRPLFPPPAATAVTAPQAAV
jgi:hypothetical protein